MKTLSKHTETERLKYYIPARYKKTTWYTITHEDGKTDAFMCGDYFNDFRTFKKVMQKKYPNQIATS